jgi:predicted phage baseplate assembly protein
MSLPVPKLDDRTFQNLVDEAKARIPLYCPEWTDHNVSDPGVTLIELFAWMTELMLYRVNQIPDKVYTKLLELIGIQLEPPRAAEAPVTLYLSAPQPNRVDIPEGTEVATVRTETSKAVVFTTEANLTIWPVNVTGIFTHGPEQTDDWVSHDVAHLKYGGAKLEVFSTRPRPGDGLYFALDADHTRHVLAVRFVCDDSKGSGVNPLDPPWSWEVWQGPGGWAPCEVEFDFTRGLNRSGDIILHAPHMEPVSFTGVLAGETPYWLRLVLTEPQPNQGVFLASPEVSQLQVESRGATIGARQAVTVKSEVLGRSDGTPGQVFKLQNAPLLARNRQRDFLKVISPAGEEEIWYEIEDFAESRETDRHYTLDSLTGELALGPSLLQPSGKVYSFGAVPAKGALLRMERYQHGGGTEGNLPQNAISVMKSSIPYVASVTNRAPASGGLDPQSLDDAKLHAPQTLRSRARAVTADDYEFIASRTERVARAYCIAPGAQPGRSDAPRPGQVVVLVLPATDNVDAAIVTPDKLILSDELAQAVQARLDAQRLLGTTVEVRSPRYLWVSVNATLRFAAGTDPAIMDHARAEGEQLLYHYLNPYIGGPRGDGWPLGRDLNRAELVGRLQQISGVEYADELRMTVAESKASAVPVAGGHVAVPSDAVICSGEHHLRIGIARDEG